MGKSRRRSSAGSKYDLSGVLSFLQSLCKLIRAGGILHAAANAFDTGNDLVDIHTLNQRCNALQVAIASTEELNVGYLTVFNIEENLLRASALGFVLVTHLDNSFLFMK